MGHLSTMPYCLTALKSVHIPTQYSKHSYADSKERLVHIFCDALQDTMGAVPYLQVFRADD